MPIDLKSLATACKGSGRSIEPVEKRVDYSARSVVL